MKRLVRLPDVLSMTGLSRSEIYRLMALERFPKVVPIGERVSAWDFDAVQAWVLERISEQGKRAEARAEIGKRLARSRQCKPDRAAA